MYSFIEPPTLVRPLEEPRIDQNKYLLFISLKLQYLQSRKRIAFNTQKFSRDVSKAGTQTAAESLKITQI